MIKVSNGFNTKLSSKEIKRGGDQRPEINFSTYKVKQIDMNSIHLNQAIKNQHNHSRSTNIMPINEIPHNLMNGNEINILNSYESAGEPYGIFNAS